MIKIRISKLSKYNFYLIIIMCVLWFNTSSIALHVTAGEISYEWEELNPTGHPGRMTVVNIAYDAENDKTILASGRFYNGTLTNNTWAFDYSTNAWEERNPINQPPQRQYSHLEYNSIEKTVVLMGGASRGGIPINDLWEYDYKTNNWTELAPHPERGWIFPKATFVDTLNALFLFSGQISLANNRIYENWWYFFDNNSWLKILPTSLPTSPFFRNPVIYNPPADNLLFFGLDGTFEFSRLNNNWTKLNSTGNPTNVGAVNVIYDSRLDLFYRFGGHTEDIDGVHGDLTGDTWIFDYKSNHWTKLEFQGDTPPVRDTGNNFEYDSGSNVGIMYGGGDHMYYEDTWALKIEDSSLSSSSIESSSSNAESSSSSLIQSTSASLQLFFVISPIILLIFRRKRNLP